MTGPYRYRTTGQGTPWIIAPDRNRSRNDGSRFVRPDDEPPFWLGLLVLIALIGAIFAAVLLAFVLIHEPPAAAPDAHASSETPLTSGVGAVAGNRELRR